MPLPVFSASVCVFCGSRPGIRPAYELAARETGGPLRYVVTAKMLY